MTNPKNTIKLLEVIPADKLYTIHNDFRKYHHKWTEEQVIELADTSGIENFYTITQYLTRTIPIAGAGLAIQGDTQTGAIIAGISLYADYLISSGKERLFQAEAKKQQITEFSKDIENVYDRQQELTEILKPLRNSDSLPELNNLLTSLRKELEEIAKKDEVNGNDLEKKWKKWLGYIFWSLRQSKNSEIKELNLLNNGIKSLDSWNKLSWTAKTWSELSRLFISLRNSDELWTEWKQLWEDRRSEHKRIKDLTSILQTAISEYRQDFSSVEIEEGIKTRMLKLEVIQKDNTKTDEDNTSEFEKEPVSTSKNNSSAQLLEDKETLSTNTQSTTTNIFRKRNISNSQENKPSQEIHELVDLQSKEEFQTKIEIPPK